jgi:bacillithiol synthase
MSTSAREFSRDIETQRVDEISFSDIPGQSRLFSQYQSDPLSLKEFYPNVSVGIEPLVEYSGEALEAYTTDRDQLVAELLRQNRELTDDETVFASIEKLRSPETVAVLTGQQAGLFSGPAYTIYKALTAVKLAAELERAGVPAVPIFWAATEDHDLEEVSTTYVARHNGDLVPLSYEPSLESAGIPVGNVRLETDIDRVVAELFENVENDAIRSLISQNWKAGGTHGQAFLKTIAGLLSRFGLVMVDPMSEPLRQMAKGVMRAAVLSSEKIAVAAAARGEMLAAAGFHSQVLVESDHVPLFRIDEVGKRVALRRDDGGNFREKNGKGKYTRDELFDEIDREPSRFSPGVMLRPVVQDAIFPTVCYIGGGAEISYFAQNSVVYEALGRPVTPIRHRASFTVAGAREIRAMEKIGLRFTDLFAVADDLRLTIAGRATTSDPVRLFAETEDELNAQLDRISGYLSAEHPTLAEHFDKRRRKMLYHIDAMRNKTLLAEARRSDRLGTRLDMLLSSLVPNGGLQERSLNFLSIIERFGPTALDDIYEAIDLDAKGHLFIKL